MDRNMSDTAEIQEDKTMIVTQILVVSAEVLDAMMTEVAPMANFSAPEEITRLGMDALYYHQVPVMLDDRPERRGWKSIEEACSE